MTILLDNPYLNPVTEEHFDRSVCEQRPFVILSPLGIQQAIDAGFIRSTQSFSSRITSQGLALYLHDIEYSESFHSTHPYQKGPLIQATSKGFLEITDDFHHNGRSNPNVTFGFVRPNVVTADALLNRGVRIDHRIFTTAPNNGIDFLNYSFNDYANLRKEPIAHTQFYAEPWADTFGVAFDAGSSPPRSDLENLVRTFDLGVSVFDEQTVRWLMKNDYVSIHVNGYKGVSFFRGNIPLHAGKKAYRIDRLAQAGFGIEPTYTQIDLTKGYTVQPGLPILIPTIEEVVTTSHSQVQIWQNLSITDPAGDFNEDMLNPEPAQKRSGMSEYPQLNMMMNERYTRGSLIAPNNRIRPRILMPLPGKQIWEGDIIASAEIFFFPKPCTN